MDLRRILLVDDCLDNHELIREALHGHFEVFGLADPMRFSDAFEVAQPDLIILDLLMPRKSGFDILEELNQKKGKEEHLPLPVIVLSAKRSVENHKRAYALGAILYLNKPFEPERLLRNIQMLIDNTKMPPMKQKNYRLYDLDRQLELRLSFQHSKIVSETDARKAHAASTQANRPGAKGPAKESPAQAKGHGKPGEDEEQEPRAPRWVG